MSLLRWIGNNLSGGPDDRALVHRFLQNRDERAFRHLYRRHAPALAQMVLRFVGGNTGDTEDVLQITWVRAIEALPRFRWESTLRSWLTGIAINCSREHQRRSIRDRKNKTKLDEAREIADGTGRSPELSADARVRRIDLERAISDLPDRLSRGAGPYTTSKVILIERSADSSGSKAEHPRVSFPARGQPSAHC